MQNILCLLRGKKFIFLVLGVVFWGKISAQTVQVIDHKGTKITLTNTDSQTLTASLNTNTLTLAISGGNTQTVSLATINTDAQNISALSFNSSTNSLTVGISGGASQSISLKGGQAGFLSDDDGDTQLQTEEGADDDTLRFDTNGIERLTLEADGRMLMGNPGNFLAPGGLSALLGMASPTYGRLRISAGAQDTFDDTQGASIDLHGNTATANAGQLDLVAGATALGSNAALRFWTNPSGTNQQLSAVLLGNGNFGLGTPSPGSTLTVSGTSSLQATLTLGGHLVDAAGSKGIEKQLLSSTATGTAWVDPPLREVSNELIFSDSSPITGYIYVSLMINGNWQVVRYKKDDPNEEATTTQTANPSQSAQPNTLALCAGLTY